jgi:hypothetical protein
MVDRKARDRVTAALRSYMNEEIAAFAFDDALSRAAEVTKDETVLSVRRALWFHYDDNTNHTLIASKQEWDYFNRLLLLLESDDEFDAGTVGRTWRWSQALAAALFIGFVVIAFREGFGPHLIVYALPFGPPSMLLAWIVSRQKRKATPRLESALTPFSSVGNLLRVRRQVPGFVKLPYRINVSKTEIRAPIVAAMMWIPGTIIWCLFAPVVLAVQMLPGRKAWDTL